MFRNCLRVVPVAVHSLLSDPQLEDAHALQRSALDLIAESEITGCQRRHSLTERWNCWENSTAKIRCRYGYQKPLYEAARKIRLEALLRINRRSLV